MESRRGVNGMQKRNSVGLVGLLAVAGGLTAQQTQPTEKVQGARDLFYFGATQKDTLPPIRKNSTAAKGAKSSPGGAPSAAQAGGAPATPGAAVEEAGGPHLGFRYQITGQGMNLTTSLMANGAWSNACGIQAALVGAEFVPKWTRSTTVNPIVNHYVTRDKERFLTCCLDPRKDWKRAIFS